MKPKNKDASRLGKLSHAKRKKGMKGYDDWIAVLRQKAIMRFTTTTIARDGSGKFLKK